MTNDSLSATPSPVNESEAGFIETTGGVRYFPKQRLWFLRGHFVMFDNEVADAYGKRLSDLQRIIKADKESYPHTFDQSHYFELTPDEYREIRSEEQIAPLLRKRRDVRDLPLVFTETITRALTSQFPVRSFPSSQSHQSATPNQPVVVNGNNNQVFINNDSAMTYHVQYRFLPTYGRDAIEAVDSDQTLSMEQKNLMKKAI